MFQSVIVAGILAALAMLLYRVASAGRSPSARRVELHLPLLPADSDSRKS
jgi:hypothetical protein